MIAEGPSHRALIESPILRGMQRGVVVRFEELTRCSAEVQDALISILSEKQVAVPELDEVVAARRGFSLIATANTRDRGVIPYPGVYLRIMPKTLHLQSHLSTSELEERYRAARDPVARSHFQIVWLLSQGRLTRDVVAATGYSPTWIRTIVQRYNANGPAGLGDRRHTNPGAVGLLSPEVRAELGQVLQSPPPDGGLWNSRKVAAWIAARTGRRVHGQRGWDYLRRLDYPPQVPRPMHAKADRAEQAAFRKNSPSGSLRSRRRTRRHRSSSGRWTSTGSA